MSQMANASSGSLPTSPQLNATLQRAFVYAEEQAHRQVSAEHLLLALTEDADAIAILQRKGIDIDHMRNEVAGLVGRNNDRFGPSEPGQPSYGGDILRVLSTAGGAASVRRPVDGALVLAALIADGTTPSAELIKLYGLTFDDITRQPQSAPPPPAPGLAMPPPLSSVRAAAREIALGQRSRREFPDLAAHTVAPLQAPVSSLRRSVAEPAAPNGGWQDEPQLPPPQWSRPEPEQPSNGTPADGGFNGYAFDPVAPMPLPAGFESSAGPAGWPAQGNGYASAPVAAQTTYSYPDEAPGYGMAEPAQYDHRQPAPANRPRQRDANADVPATNRPKTQGRKSSGKGRRQPARNALVENIPRRMLRGVAHIVEARVSRQTIEGMLRDLRGENGLLSQDLPVTQAVTVRLRSADGGFTIESGSPETQWFEGVLGLQQDDFASWKWTLTPKLAGSSMLQLLLSARAIEPDGLMGETALPDQMIEVQVGTNFSSQLGRIAAWLVFAAVIGGIGAFGEYTLRIFSRLLGH